MRLRRSTRSFELSCLLAMDDQELSEIEEPKWKSNKRSHHEAHEGHEGFRHSLVLLRALRITMLLDFLYSRKFLSGQSCEFFCACLALPTMRSSRFDLFP